ncbi:unnamed protein product [Durusdinium trenchii]|uniref:Pentatricopeptide repeat-containing protein n=1 Tax=Durusdinium trenchii TaxID=1381693 RepID=A0ABP0NEW7_9DINO
MARHASEISELHVRSLPKEQPWIATRWLQRVAQAGDADALAHCLSQMREGDLQVNCIHYGVLLRVEHWEASLQTLGAMRHKHLDPDSVNRGIVMHAMRNEGWESGLSLLDGGLSGNNAALASCPWDHSLKLFDEMAEGRLASDTISHNTLIKALEDRSSRTCSAGIRALSCPMNGSGHLWCSPCLHGQTLCCYLTALLLRFATIVQS